MHDKRKQSEEGSSASVQDVDRKNDVNYVKLENNNSGNGQVHEQLGGSLPSGYYRQGYCSCCQVHYINLEKHLASDQHRRISKLHRNRLSTSTLMERFLQDVHLYHPQNYHDARPTYDDIPDVNVLPSSHEDRICTLSQENQTAVSSSETLTGWDKQCKPEIFSSRSNCNETTFTQSGNINSEEAQCSKTGNHQQSIFRSSLTTCQKALCKTINTIPRTFDYSTLPLYSTSKLTSNNSSFKIQHPLLCSESSNNRETSYEKCKKCPSTATSKNPINDFQNRQFKFQGSYHLTSGTLFKDERIFKSQENKESILRDHKLCNDSNKQKNDGKFCRSKNKGFNLSRYNGSLVDEIIEAVIKKYCNEPSSDKTTEKDEESVLSLNVPSITENSTLSFDWNIPLELKEDHLKITMTNVDLHKQSDVNIDEEYKSKLKYILRENPTNEVQTIKHEQEEEVLPALPHIPPSFVGKTWSQVMYEDDLKIEALVKEFRKGKFHCYFEDDCSMHVGSKRKHKSRQIDKKVEAKTEDLAESQKMNLLPLFEDFCEDHHPDTLSIKSERPLKSKLTKPCKRVWRQASRCQVVKVSHGTQTSLVNYPVVKKKVLKNESRGVFDDLEEEKTPDMKTRMCALKLPESYTKILTPLQPKTMVYVLSHPDVKSSICRRSRNQCSTDSRDSIYYKYKQSPLKYYDPLTNRILKTPPRNSVRGMSSKALCVRKLFRSLSSERNVDKVDPEQKESNTSKKSLSSCSVASLHFGSVKGKDVSSSIKGSGSSVNSEYTSTGYVKSAHSEKPYAHITISPCKAANIKAKEDTQHSILLSKSKSKPLKQQNRVMREPQNCSTRHSKSRIESRDAVRSKHNPNRMVKNLEKQTQRKSKCRKQPRKKSSSVLPKSNKSFAQARQSNKEKVTNQRNESTVQKRLVKSRLVSLNPKKRKQSIAKNSFPNNYQDKNITRSRSKSSEIIVQNTMHYLRSRHAVANKASNTRTFTNTLTRRKVR